MSGQKIEVTGIKFRRLVIPEGDILIKLSGAPEDTILIPSAYLRQSQFLTIVLSSRWLKQDDDRCRLLKHPITGNDVKVHQLLLSFVEDSTTGKKKSTFFVLKDDIPEWTSSHWNTPIPLKSDKCSDYVDFAQHRFVCDSAKYKDGELPHGSCLQEMTHFNMCGMSNNWNNSLVPSPPVVRRFEAHVNSIVAHKIIFGYVADRPPIFDSANVSHERQHLADCVELMRYYDLNHVVAPSLSRDIKRMPGFWANVQLHPAYYMTLGSKLKDEELFLEAFRHYVATRRDRSPVPGVDDWADENVLKLDIMTAKYREQLWLLVADLEKAVRVSMLKLYTTADSIDRVTNRYVADTCERDTYIAHGTVSTWFNDSLQHSRNPLHTLQTYEAIRNAATRRWCHRIQFLSQDISGDIARLAQNYTPPPNKQHMDSATVIKELLDAFVTYAAKQINDILTELPCAVKSTEALDHFMHFEFDRDDLPWDWKKPWPLPKQLQDQQTPDEMWLQAALQARKIVDGGETIAASGVEASVRDSAS